MGVVASGRALARSAREGGSELVSISFALEKRSGSRQKEVRIMSSPDASGRCGCGAEEVGVVAVGAGVVEEDEEGADVSADCKCS